MRNPKGYLLNEMILLIALVSVIMLLSVKPVQTFFRGILATQRVFEQQGQIDRLLLQLQRDTENAATAVVQPGDARLGGDVLFLSGPQGVVSYQLADGSATCIRDGETQQWPLPKTSFQWRLLTINDAQAVAVTAYQQRAARRDGTPAFHGTYLFIVYLNTGFLSEPQK